MEQNVTNLMNKMKAFYKLLFITLFMMLYSLNICNGQNIYLRGNKAKKFYRQVVKLLHIDQNKFALIPNSLKEYLENSTEFAAKVEKNFMKDSLKYNLDSSNFYSILETESIPFKIDSTCRNELSNELLKYTTKRTLDSILNETPVTKKFKSRWLKNLNVYLVDTIRIKFLKQIVQYGNNFIKTSALSAPIFFNRNRSCLIAYSQKHLKGGSEIILFKKTNKHWSIVKRLCEDYY